MGKVVYGAFWDCGFAGGQGGEQKGGREGEREGAGGRGGFLFENMAQTMCLYIVQTAQGPPGNTVLGLGFDTTPREGKGLVLARRGLDVNAISYALRCRSAAPLWHLCRGHL